MRDATASQQIDAIIQKTAGWRGERLAQLRTLIRDADQGVVEEVKWKKPSRPEGVPIWSHDGIVCLGEALKNAVRTTRTLRDREAPGSNPWAPDQNPNTIPARWPVRVGRRITAVSQFPGVVDSYPPD